MQRSYRRSVWWLGAIALPVALAGCSTGPNVWVERTESITVPAADLKTLVVKTHNGAVHVTGEEGRADIAVTARIKGGATTRESAEAALQALELVSQTENDGTHRLGARWSRPKERNWHEQVSFQIVLPARLAVDVETHNGEVTLKEVHGETRLTTHNGAINVAGAAARVAAHTHNGAIDADTSGDEVDLQTHNGSIDLDATTSPKLGGQVGTHNGAVRIQVGKHTTAALSCETENGAISCPAELRNRQQSSRKASGALGEGGPALAVTTHNGAIDIEVR